MKSKIVKTYHRSDTDPAQMKAWQANWRNHGWTPRILTHWDARRSKLYREGLSEDATQWLAFAESKGGLLVTPYVVVQGEIDFPPVDSWGAVSLCKACPECVVVATAMGAEEIAWDVMNGKPVGLDKVAELCVWAGSHDAKAAPLVLFQGKA